MADMKIELLQRPLAVLNVADVPAGEIEASEIAGLIASAHEVLEASLNRHIGERVLKLTYGQWTGSAVLLHDPTEVLEVTAAGEPTEEYTIDGRVLTVEGEAPVTITYKVGWTKETVPTRVRQALLAVIDDLVKNPGVLASETMYVNAQVEALAALYRLGR